MAGTCFKLKGSVKKNIPASLAEIAVNVDCTWPQKPALDKGTLPGGGNWFPKAHQLQSEIEVRDYSEPAFYNALQCRRS